MLTKVKVRPDVLLLLSLLLVILIYPALDHGTLRKLVLAALMFLPVILATVRLSRFKGWVWPSLLFMTVILVLTIAGVIFPLPAVLGVKWFVLAAFFGLTAILLFSYLRDAQSVTNEHLFTAASIYLLIGIIWFSLYNAIDILTPGSIVQNNTVMTDRSTDLLYFSLVTLSTIGYGDIVPVGREVRMLAALEGIVGVLYIAITVAVLISAYRRPTEPQ